MGAASRLSGGKQPIHTYKQPIHTYTPIHNRLTPLTPNKQPIYNAAARLSSGGFPSLRRVQTTLRVVAPQVPRVPAAGQAAGPLEGRGAVDRRGVRVNRLFIGGL